MPNWVMNRVEIEGKEERVQELLKFVKTEESVFDFNTIIPMPESLNIDSTSLEDNYISSILTAINPATKDFGEEKLSGREFVAVLQQVKEAENYTNLVVDKKEIVKEYLEKGKIYLSNILNYGHSTWYGWCKKNWGCKWNACDAEVKDNTIIFQTPWVEPKPIFDELAKKFPDLIITTWYAEEQIGYYVGKRIYKEGKLENDIEFTSGSQEAIEVADYLWLGL